MLDNTALYNALVDLDVIDKGALDDAFSECNEASESLSETLLDRDLISDENLGMLIADILKVPFARLGTMSMEREVLQTLSEEMSRSRRVIAFKKDTEGTHIAMEKPDDLATLALIKKKISGQLKIYFATERDILFALFSYQRAPAEVFEEMISKSTEEMKGSDKGEAPIIKIVDTMMVFAYQSRASDVHIEPYEEYLQFRFRIDGILSDVIRLPKELEDQIISRIKIISNLPTDEHASALDGKFTFDVIGVEEVDVRVSILPTTHGERVVMRLLASNMRQYALLDLGFSEADINKVREAYTKPYGMVLATGPTGSGKTTTMYAFMKILNKRNVNIMTIEDPVEYQIKGVNQIQVNPKTELTFAAGLKSIVRQDPNVILVGEIRDEETAGIAVNAALTGHLVLSTLHTNDAATTFPRMLDMGIEPFLLASSINLVVAQRLVRKICTNCRMSEVVSIEDLKNELPMELLKKGLEKEGKGVRVYVGKGCEVCKKTGYLGRVGIYEVMPMSANVKEAVVAKKDADEIKKIAVKDGMRTMVEDGLEKVKLGITTVEELLRVIKS